jgi:hypothetical protein
LNCTLPLLLDDLVPSIATVSGIKRGLSSRPGPVGRLPACASRVYSASVLLMKQLTLLYIEFSERDLVLGMYKLVRVEFDGYGNQNATSNSGPVGGSDDDDAVLVSMG